MKNVMILVIGALMIVGLMSAGTQMMSNVVVSNPVFLNGTERAMYNTFNNTRIALDSEIEGTVNDTEASLDATVDKGSWGFVDSFYKSVMETIKSIGKSMTFFTAFFTSMGQLLGLPPWVFSLVVSAIMIIIGFTIWRSMLNN